MMEYDGLFSNHSRRRQQQRRRTERPKHHCLLSVATLSFALAVIMMVVALLSDSVETLDAITTVTATVAAATATVAAAGGRKDAGISAVMDSTRQRVFRIGEMIGNSTLPTAIPNEHHGMDHYLLSKEEGETVDYLTVPVTSRSSSITSMEQYERLIPNVQQEQDDTNIRELMATTIVSQQHEEEPLIVTPAFMSATLQDVYPINPRQLTSSDNKPTTTSPTTSLTFSFLGMISICGVISGMIAAKRVSSRLKRQQVDTLQEIWDRRLEDDLAFDMAYTTLSTGSSDVGYGSMASWGGDFEKFDV